MNKYGREGEMKGHWRGNAGETKGNEWKRRMQGERLDSSGKTAPSNLQAMKYNQKKPELLFIRSVSSSDLAKRLQAGLLKDFRDIPGSMRIDRLVSKIGGTLVFPQNGSVFFGDPPQQKTGGVPFEFPLQPPKSFFLQKRKNQIVTLSPSYMTWTCLVN